MKTISFFDTKPYDQEFFEKMKEKMNLDYKIHYFESKLGPDTAVMAKGSDAAVAFVNDMIEKKTLDILYENGIRILAMRCAGYNNIDFKAAFGKIHIVRVPAYSPYAVAEHTMGMLLTLNRKLHRAYNRTKEYNFSLTGLTGFDLKGKTIGVIGTGKIGQVFMDICRGFGMDIIAFDPYPAKDKEIKYVSLEELCQKSDIISLHCPLTKDNYHIIHKETLQQMKKGVFILNTSRGALIDSDDLLEAIKSGQVGAAGLDVYEEETDLFYEDYSDTIIQDDVLARLISMPNVLVTSHQAFLTEEALSNIAETTLKNITEFFNGELLTNEICYQCSKDFVSCNKKFNRPCF